jgi:succinate dehydrogenase flavin-adding protein (antitoxin of CptAB toxin-antitoxin module)
MDKTIKQVLGEFLEEQQVRLKPGTYRGYEEAIYLFEQCLNGYAYQYLEEESRLFDRLYDEEDKEFCEIFGPDKIGASEIGEFLDYFVIRKVMGGKELMKTVGRVMRRFVRWMSEKGYMEEGEYEAAAGVVEDLKGELPRVEELACLIYDYIQDNPPKGFTERVDGYFRATKIEPGKLWLKDYLSGRDIGPVFVSNEISSSCKLGWVICLELGKTRKGWRMLGSGNVYPR